MIKDTKEPIIVDSFVPGRKMMICPHQTWFGDRFECKYQFPAGDGAFLVCTYENCIELKKCKLEADKEQSQNDDN